MNHSGFIRLTYTSGKDFYVNPLHLISFGKGWVCITGGTDDIPVQETENEIMSRLQEVK